MKMKCRYLLIVITILTFATGCAMRTKDKSSDNMNSNVTPTKMAVEAELCDTKVIEMDYGDYFNGIEGTVVFYDNNEETIMFMAKTCQKRDPLPAQALRLYHASWD